MKKISPSILCLLLFALSAKGQDKVILHYNSNWEITNKDNASYYREAEYDFNKLKLNGKVRDYTLPGNLIMEGDFINGKRDGNFVNYFDNGKVQSEGKYENNRRLGYWKFYYENGSLKQVVLFRPSERGVNFGVVEYYDRNLKPIITNGTGNWVNDSIKTGLFDRKSLTILTGKFKDSLMHGTWKLVRISDRKLMHSESFNKGKFISATVYNPDFNHYGTMKSEMLNKFPNINSKKFYNTQKFKLDTAVFDNALLNADVETIFKTVTGKDYKVQNRSAGYLYGDYALLEWIGLNIKYPRSAMRDNISGKVYVNIAIDSLGSAKEIKLLKGVDPILNAEAIRVVSLIEDWMPAIKNGKTVYSTITIPVNFYLAK